MMPALQTALVALVWALSVSVVIFVASACNSACRKTETSEKKEKTVPEIEPKVSIAYLCDGGCSCGSSPGCHMNGGTCNHTSNVEHAVNFEQMSFPPGATMRYYYETFSNDKEKDND